MTSYSLEVTEYPDGEAEDVTQRLIDALEAFADRRLTLSADDIDPSYPDESRAAELRWACDELVPGGRIPYRDQLIKIGAMALSALMSHDEANPQQQ